jgi:hypothetical protein
VITECWGEYLELTEKRWAGNVACMWKLRKWLYISSVLTEICMSLHFQLKNATTVYCTKWKPRIITITFYSCCIETITRHWQHWKESVAYRARNWMSFTTVSEAFFYFSKYFLYLLIALKQQQKIIQVYMCESDSVFLFDVHLLQFTESCLAGICWFKIDAIILSQDRNEGDWRSLSDPVTIDKKVLIARKLKFYLKIKMPYPTSWRRFY